MAVSKGCPRATVLVWLLAFASACTSGGVGEEWIDPDVVWLDRTLIFEAEDGDPCAVPEGAYRVSAAGESALELEPESGGSAFRVLAGEVKQGGVAAGAQALCLPGATPEELLVALLDGAGRGLVAVGRKEAVRTRGLTPVPGAVPGGTLTVDGKPERNADAEPANNVREIEIPF